MAVENELNFCLEQLGDENVRLIDRHTLEFCALFLRIHAAEIQQAILNDSRYRLVRESGCPFAETDAAWDSPEALDDALDKVIANSVTYVLTAKGRELLEKSKK